VSRPRLVQEGAQVEVDRVVDASRPQGVELSSSDLGTVGLRDVDAAEQHGVLRPLTGAAKGNVHAQITIRSISSTVTVSAVRS